jgi:menaquinol-cytochrome c reductase iron-sulfur subunit
MDELICSGSRQRPGRGLDEVVSRRRFLSRVSLALSGIAGAVLGVPVVGYLLSPLLNPPPDVWRDLGPIDQYSVGETVDVVFEEPSPLPWAGQTARTAAWLRRSDASTFTAFAMNCTHLGCPVNWRPQSRLFLCPCHGGVYDENGQVVGGPPPRALFQYPVRVQDGQVQIHTGPLPLG